jgi:hypothetical protein
VELAVISLMFVTIALAGCLLAVVLITRAVRADDRNEALAERCPPTTSQPAWVGPNLVS